jgi:hypothetical protein
MIRTLLILFAALVAMGQRQADYTGSGLTHRWTFEDGRVFDAYNPTAVVFVATATNFAPSPMGNALDCSTRETWVNTMFRWEPGTADFSVSFWVRLPNQFPTARDQQLCMSATYTNGYGSGVMYQVSTYVATNTFGAEWYLSGEAVSSATMVKGPWYNIALTRAGTVARSYVNGAHFASVTSALIGQTATTLQTLHFNRRWYPTAAGVTNAPCEIDDYCIYNRALTPAEISRAYAEQAQ